MSIRLTTGGSLLDYWRADATPDGLEVHAFWRAEDDVTVHAPGGASVRHSVIRQAPLTMSVDGRSLWLVSCSPGERISA